MKKNTTNTKDILKIMKAGLPANKSEVIAFRVTKATADWISKHAKELGISKSLFVEKFFSAIVLKERMK
ncbi:MAG: hypothetical protein LBP70_01685 [Mycoplasmataceae bacterium]|nr:hypothetical protein [Mycoplasmataceae bacterium]